MLRVFTLLVLLLSSHCAVAWKLQRVPGVALRAIASPFLVAVSLGAPLVPDALANEQLIDTPVVLDRGVMGADPIKESRVRVVDLGGNRGARGLASNGVQGGSLVDQLKAYGGPGAVVKEDTSLKNPFKQSNTNAGIEAQLKLYQSLQAK